MSRRTRRAANPAVLPVARHARLRRATTLGVITRFVAGTLAVVLVSGAAVAGFAVWDVQNSLKPAVRLANDSASQAPGISAIEGGVNLLIVGSDTRDGQDEEFGSAEVDGGVLNDVTMLVHIADDHRSMSVVSFPRDMFVPIPSCPRSDGSGSFSAVSSQKINTTLSRGGLPCTVLTVEQLTGLTIPYAALIDFNGVVELSNAVGGVEVCVATPINDPLTNLTLEAGLQTLTGTEVTQFLRTRH
ncbi:MAG: LCP family protein, partial [Mycetocola sp.]